MSEHEDLQLVGDFPFVPKQERAQQKRNSLLESGRELFIKNGYEPTTAKEIATHAGVAIGTFYRYFSDKRQLLMALLQDQLDKMLPPEPNWIRTNPEELLAAILENHYKQLEQIGLHQVLPELIIRDPELAEVLIQSRKNWHKRILAGLQLAKKKGRTWPDLELEMVAWSILVILENVPKKEKEVGQKTDYMELAKLICRLVFPPKGMTI
ncbi:TetR/AcrR family transcriptional regulator [Bacillus tuaregi]|uniref:TetR/AcrR family transcriptional regulator n=1 Tax=Bacillus tuaregi TaxID=1816695 RepID=UPI0008F83D35|nr:TetR/AcrR family transcriptional regulator [Bacillus tuaregi]